MDWSFRGLSLWRQIAAYCILIPTGVATGWIIWDAIRESWSTRIRH